MLKNKDITVEDLKLDVAGSADRNEELGRVKVKGAESGFSFRISSQIPDGALQIDLRSGVLAVANEECFATENNSEIKATVEVTIAGATLVSEVRVRVIGLTEEEQSLMEYFKEVALGFEFGNASKVTRSWVGDIRIFVMGEPADENLSELKNIIREINGLIGKKLQLRLVKNREKSNLEIFFGPGGEYAEINDRATGLVESNWGLFFVKWDEKDNLIRGTIYVDTSRASPREQAHLLREEITQCLGLANDSDRYEDSIFHSSFATQVTQYSEEDKKLIRMLYHPAMKNGLTAEEVSKVLRKIMITERN